MWFVSPIDLVPEFIPVLGPLDDALLAALVVRHLVRRAGSEVVAEAWPGDPATLDRMLRLARVPGVVPGRGSTSADAPGPPGDSGAS